MERKFFIRVYNSDDRNIRTTYVNPFHHQERVKTKIQLKYTYSKVSSYQKWVVKYTNLLSHLLQNAISIFLTEIDAPKFYLIIQMVAEELTSHLDMVVVHKVSVYLAPTDKLTHSLPIQYIYQRHSCTRRQLSRNKFDPVMKITRWTCCSSGFYHSTRPVQVHLKKYDRESMSFRGQDRTPK